MQPADTAPQEVLLVEADEVAARVSTFWLERAGFRVRLAEDGNAALAAVRQAPPQVVVSAVQLPDADGWTLLHRLREAAGVVLPSVLASVLERHAAPKLADNVEYLNQPFEGPALVRAVRRTLRRFRCGGRLPRLLVVHDDESALRHVGRQLDEAGFEVVEALGVDEACVLAGTASFEAVVVAADDAGRCKACLQPHTCGNGPWLRLGPPPQSGAWQAVVDSPTELATAVETLLDGLCVQP